ncbi:Carboxypeptidase A4 [Mortierella sp. NVP85]|nr:Carboxypeptidase A4 [Mortierella sp. NVP85]
MRLLKLSLALTLSAACAAYPYPQGQYPFAAVHSTNHQGNENHGEYARFDNEQVLRVQVSSMAELKLLEAVVEEKNLDLWSNLRIGTVDIRVPASEIEDFKAIVPLPSSVMIPNLQDLVPEQAPAALQSNLKKWNFMDDSFWNNYHDLATLNNFTETMVARFPELVTRTSLGHTHEGREVFGLTIHGYDKEDKTPDDNEDHDNDDDGDKSDDELDLEDLIEDLVKEVRAKARSWWSWLAGSSPKVKTHKKSSKPKKDPKAILFHGGQHAREWIGPATVTYIAKELILGYGVNKKITKLVDQFEFTIIPVLNADGYAYTWERNRMWRKNRQPTSIPFCPGIDPNRNWGYKWNNGGSSGNPCSEAYHGPRAFAANEPKMVADYINKKGNVVGYIDFHAYSQLWMTPFGGDCAETPKDDEDIMEGGLIAAKALKDVHGTKFAVGSVCNIIYQASGGSLDWTYAEGGVKYSYAVELRDTGRHGFMLPKEEILPSGQETFAAFLNLANFIRKREKQWGHMV